jgi:hypothetical protein
MTGGEHRRLIIFTRYPEPGRVKTRLIPALGEAGAANLHHWMAVRTLAQARRFRGEVPATLEVRFEGGTEASMRRWLGPDLQYRPQGKGDLGERLSRAFQEAFAAGEERVVIIGTDCPAMRAYILQRAFEQLEGHDLALGPAIDGGYYLIGLRRATPESATGHLFSDIAWGTGEVLTKTVERTRNLGLSFALLEPLDDIDRPEDLAIWKDKAEEMVSPGSISMIVPAHNEAEEIGLTLTEARRGSDLEIIVVDGESDDGTPEIARAHGAKVFSCPPGRARQMNTGAVQASGDILLFLHADTRLPPGFGAKVRQALARPITVGGAFALRIDAPLRSLRLIEGLANWRSKRLKLPYGDQAIFLRTDVFWELGGFPDIPIMEDFELTRRMARRGEIVILPDSVLTSARRWKALGVWRTTLVNQIVIAAYSLGVSPYRIARWYRRAGK